VIGALSARQITSRRADTPEGVAREMVAGRPDLVIVDLREDAGLGDGILSWVSQSASAATLVITDPNQVDARIGALLLGSADHIVAPLDPREAAARAESLIERLSTRRQLRIETGDIVIDVAQRSAHRAGELVSLTPRELSLLLTLVQRAHEIVSKQQLLQTVWRDEDRSENVVEATVSSLRRKLHRLGPPVIHTVHRCGYVFRPISPAQHRPGGTRTEMPDRGRMARERDAQIAQRDATIRGMRTERDDPNQH
jgi:two-component system, OmpR family, response regulator